MASNQTQRIRNAMYRTAPASLQVQTAQEIAWGIALGEMLGVDAPSEDELAASMKIKDAGQWHSVYAPPAYIYPQGG
jgi:hypothetical protein